MSFEKRLRIRLGVGLAAVIVTMFTAPFGGRTLGVFPLWVIAWGTSMIGYIALYKPILGIMETAKEVERKDT